MSAYNIAAMTLEMMDAQLKELKIRLWCMESATRLERHRMVFLWGGGGNWLINISLMHVSGGDAFHFYATLFCSAIVAFGVVAYRRWRARLRMARLAFLVDNHD